MEDKVNAWQQMIIIPTYAPAKPEKNPIFLEKRVYQGSSGAVYPHPVIERIADIKTNKEYTALFIENKYLRIMVLPELGGRIQRAYDKIRKRDFVYYNQVIKPALVGLTGPWISGGIEFNWPQHHRPSTFEPVDFSIEENEDGSKTIWVNEIEVISRTKGMAGFTLYPKKAYLEVKGKIFNRTSLPQTFLWWANPAVKVNDHYESVFPPDVHAVFDHGKRDVSDFPIATGTYYKVNYAPGTDISKYKNIPVPTSFMAAESKYDFIGGYENDTHAGMLHVADHHYSPGKKQWTWGKGNFGEAWDKNLTDEDGPYIELMCGVYTDNQPDFSWLQPNEEKTFEQYFMPYAEIGKVHNASKDVAINFEQRNSEIELRIYSSGEFPGASVELTNGDVSLFKDTINLSPEKSIRRIIQIDKRYNNPNLLLEISYNNFDVLLSHRPEPTEAKPVPPPATAAQEPSKITTTELLYLNGVHLEQYRHATYQPVDYYLEALQRDPSDIRNNNALGKWYLRHGQPAKAELFLRTAVKSMTIRNGNPYDGEPMYNLALCLKSLNKVDEAFDLFYKSTWNDAFQHSAYLQLARIASVKKDFRKALYLIEKSINRNYTSSSARHLKTSLLRKTGDDKAAIQYALCSLKIDPFNFGCHFELELMKKHNRKKTFPVRKTFSNYAEYAIDYASAGMIEESLLLLRSFEADHDLQTINPLCYYYMGWLSIQLNDNENAGIYFTKAASASPDYCFPSRVEDVRVLNEAVRFNNKDAKAYYYLGNYWYAHHNQKEAIACWQKSAELDSMFPTVFRNLALAYYNHMDNKVKSLDAMETAFKLDPTDARVLMELDQLYRQLNYSHWYRLKLLEENVQLVEQRHDLYLERVTLYNLIGDFETADALIKEWKFQPWEGGEGKVVAQYKVCKVQLAKQAIENAEYKKAIDLLNAADWYPENLGEGKLPNVPSNDIQYWKAVAHRKMGDASLAEMYFVNATSGDNNATQAIFYNDSPPEQVFYKAEALKCLGLKGEAGQIFKNLVEFGELHMNDDIKIDYFAVSLPDLRVFNQDLKLKNEIHCNYLIALGYLGMGKKEAALSYFAEVLKKDVNHQGALLMQYAELYDYPA